MRTPRYRLILVLLVLAAAGTAVSVSQLRPVAASSVQSFTIEQIKGYPFPSELTACATGARSIAMASVSRM